MFESLSNILSLFPQHPYGWFCPGGDSHTKNVVILLIIDDFMTFWWYYFERLQEKYLWQILSWFSATNLELKHDFGGAPKVA